MTTPARRRGPRLSPDEVAGLDESPTQPTAPTRGLTKAPTSDPVTGQRGQATAAPGAVDQAQNAGGSPEAGGPEVKKKVGYAQYPSDTARARAAYRWTSAAEGHRSFSDFIAHALMVETKRLEAKYNDGKEWNGMSAGEIPTGRPFD